MWEGRVMVPSQLEFSAEPASKVSTSTSDCANEITRTTGDQEVTSSATLAGTSLSGKASTAGTAVSSARTTFSSRLTKHSNGMYNAARTSRQPKRARPAALGASKPRTAYPAGRLPPVAGR